MSDSFPGVRPDLTVSCVDPDGRACEGRVVDVLGSGPANRVVVAFPSERSPGLPVGGRAELELAGATLADPLRTEAQVVYCARESSGDVYQFALAGGLASSLEVALGRRRSFRVQPKEQLEVELSSDAGRASGVVVDLSLHGAAVAIDCPTDLELAADWTVTLSFRLPEDQTPIRFAGRIQFRKLVGSTVRLGVEFDPLATLDHAANEHRLAGYVLRRQTEVLRAMIDPG